MHTFLEGTTCRDLVRELGRRPPVDSNELFGIATSFASGEEAVGAIFDGKKVKHVDDASVEGNKSKEPTKKWARRARSLAATCVSKGAMRTTTRPSLSTLPARALEDPHRGPGVLDDMLKKPCPYHKSPVNHTLEQCDMLKKILTASPRKRTRPRRTELTQAPEVSPQWRTSSSSSGGGGGAAVGN
jgi:hypothetical protein